ncbi:uncharacterized protein TNIN_430391 [Trichonephila inaurata madagascariensis]|uniref:Endonuclease/exonuclease/phosphatase domain-containing protein n=1 Tax=Trichonephila inaurata madagascariensis TaxID=2747483 RepID=A0A8X6ISW6_9ARAC|nr:uncharacterized protein TNIN_430391 [Trichonephila inaurata madagascariensis]
MEQAVDDQSINMEDLGPPPKPPSDEQRCLKLKSFDKEVRIFSARKDYISEMLRSKSQYPALRRKRRRSWKPNCGLSITRSKNWKELNRTYPTATNTFTKGYIKIEAQTADDHRDITNYLTGKKLQYYVIEPPSNRPLKLVIKGLPADLDPEDIKNDLISKGIKIEKIAQLKKFTTKTPLPIYMIEVTRDENVNDIYQERQDPSPARWNVVKFKKLYFPLPFSPIPPLLTGVEATLIMLTPIDHDPILIGSTYIPPINDYFKNLGAALDTIFNLNNMTILVGGFNAKHTSWGCPYSNTRGNRLYRYIVSNGIDVFAPSTPTRFGTASASIIDYASSLKT